MGYGAGPFGHLQNGDRRDRRKRRRLRGSNTARHHDSDEIIYVLNGQMTFKIGEDITVGGPGTYGFMPRGLAHAWKNSGPDAGRSLFIFTPGVAGKIFEDLRREQRALS